MAKPSSARPKQKPGKEKAGPREAAREPEGQATAPPRPRRRWRRLRILLRVLAALLLLGLTAATAVGVWAYRRYSRDLPERWSELTDYRPPKASRVYSSEGEVIGEFFLEKRVVVPYERIPQHVVHAFVAAEDNRFFDHRGVDPVGIVRAAFANLKAGRVVQGGSTITQQLAKLMLIGGERKLERKIREAILAYRIEKKLSKPQIMSIYLSHVYLGHGAYGVQAAAEIYFGKDVEHLTVGEAAMIAGLPKAPTEDSPFTAFPRARERQLYVIGQMQENGFITAEDAEAARREPIAIISRDDPLNNVAAPYFVEHVRKHVQQKVGLEHLFNRGLQIHTTLSMRQQRSAETAVRRGLEDLDRRLGFRGPLGRLDGDEQQRFRASGPIPYVPLVEEPSAAPARPPAEPPPPAEPRPGKGAGAKGAKAPAPPPAKKPPPPFILPSVTPGGPVLRDKAYVGMIEAGAGRGPSQKAPRVITVLLGGQTYPLAEEDAGRVERWAARVRQPIATGDLLPLRIRTLERKKGRRVEAFEAAVLAQQPDVQAALVAVDPATGWLTAMVGGYDYNLSKFNRAVQARRQAGSSIKPFIYAAAVDKGLTEVSIVPDAPIVIRTAAGLWAPHNYKNEFLGPVTLRTALAKSLNTVSVRLVEMVGVERTIETFRRFGLTSPITRHISIALGTPEVSPMEAAYAQATFPAAGMEVRPVFVTRILDADGNVVEENVPKGWKLGAPPPPQEGRKRRIGEDTAYVLVDLMKNVVANGTGRKALALGRPTAGKTGTSNDFRDAWFVGYTADLLAVVWVGRDSFETIGHDTTGGQTALPLWLDFMMEGHPATPPREFPVPPSVILVRATGDKGLPAPPGTPGSTLIPFRRGTLPPQFAAGGRAASFAEESF